MELLYGFQVVGGPYDGTPGLEWIDDGDHAPPPAIFVGRCRGDGSCGMRICRKGKPHVAYWTPEEDRPTGCRRYEKQEEFVRRLDDELRGTVVYAIGGLMDPRNFGSTARLPVGTPAPAPILASAHADEYARQLDELRQKVPPLTFAGASRWGFLRW